MEKKPRREEEICDCRECMWTTFAVVFLFATLVLGGTVIFLIINNKDLRWTIQEVEERRGSEKSPNIKATESNRFAELSQSEINEIVRYLLNNIDLDLTPSSEAGIGDNYIYMMEVVQPPKELMLNYLRTGQDKPERQALVVLMNGKHQPQPQVNEIIVRPLSKIENWRPHRTIPWKIRPRRSPAEMSAMSSYLEQNLALLDPMLMAYTGFQFSNCSMDEACLRWTFSTPPVPTNEHRNTWINFRQPYPGDSLHSVPLYILVEDEGTDPSAWRIVEIVWKGTLYATVEQLATAIAPSLDTAERINKTSKARERTSTKGYSSRPSRVAPETKGEGRYLLDGQRVRYLDWDIDFRHKVSSGLQLFNVRFNGTRIIYELSTQGIISHYSGQNPFMMHARYLENLEPLGNSVSKLVPGLDCPTNADFFDGFVYSASMGWAVKQESHICIFEHDINVPMKRHRNYDRTGGGAAYGGIPSKAMVIRSINTFVDIDFIFDYIFHTNGAIEAKFYTSGYPMGAFWAESFPGENKYGFTISDFQASPITEHFVNYKLDLDIHGTANRFGYIDIEPDSLTNPYFQKEEMIQRKLVHTHRTTELLSTLEFDFEDPKLLIFYNETMKNRFKSHKAYRLILNGIAKKLLLKNWKWEKGVAWARYQVAVTKHKETEASSYSMYDALDPYSPVVNFQSFLDDNESIVDEDLVAWVTVGDYRVPSTSDVPLMSTLDHQAGFKLVPFNYFEEDPCHTHQDWIWGDD